MKPFRKNVAIAVDGGGIRGVIVTTALSILEDAMGSSVTEIFRLAAGTSTGSIISAGIGAWLRAADMQKLYIELGEQIFKKSWRTAFWPLTRYRYPHRPLELALQHALGDIKMGDFWINDPVTDVVITTFDLLANKTRFVKPWKEEYREWPVVKALLASSSVPTYFPIVDGRYVDGGVGSYANPCYVAAYEAQFCLNWKPEETTLISLGTGRDPHTVKSAQLEKYYPWDWIEPILGAFLNSADDQQVHLVDTFFKKLDFRRFQVNLKESIPMDDTSQLDTLVAYGEIMGQNILNDVYDQAHQLKAVPIPSR
ncbi:MAG: patatin-like phospholipase family protein [Anaerolineales bacterium]